MKPKQFIVLVPVRDPNNSYIVATSRQHTKDMAERDIFMRLEEAKVSYKSKMHIQELIVEDDGTLRIVDEKGRVLPLATWKV